MMSETPANRDFLALWLATLLDHTGASLNRSALGFYQSLIDHVLTLPKTQRRMSVLYDLVRQADALMAQPLKRYVSGEALGHLFDAPAETFTPSGLFSLHLAPWMNDPTTRVPLCGYLLHRLTSALNQSPTLIAMSQGLDILDTPLFSSRVAGWLDFLSQNNAGVFITCGDVDRAALYPYAPTVASRAATMFAMSDTQPDAGYSFGFGFSGEDIATLAYLKAENRHVLQKRGDESIVIQANLHMVPPATLQILRGKSNQPTKQAADVLAELMGYHKQPA
jgi:type IV secretory pathway VirB4 component